MTRTSSIITVGFSPAWDITCRHGGIDWGRHQVIKSFDEWPAGKALNISRALAWIGERNTAAGLWGRCDYEQMFEALADLKRMVRIKFTVVAGSTRKNITVVDTVNDREMHLRAVSRLASVGALRKLKTDLHRIVNKKSVCVFSGAMPEKQLLREAVQVIKSCRSRGAEIAVDTSGAALRRIVNTGDVWLIKPNIEELSELLGEQVGDNLASLAKAGRKLLDKVDIVLISRGKKGAVVVAKNGARQGRCAGGGKVLSTIACGDYLLAGFLKGLKDTSDTGLALETAIKVATARAWGLPDKLSWQNARRKIKVQVRKI